MLFCSTIRLVNVAAAQLSAHPYVFVDCEGRDLGDETGALSTIVIGTPNGSSVSLFDALALDAAALKPILNILTSTRIGKVVWDGKMDAIEFKRTFGITINKVWDLQLLDITTRARRGDRDGRKFINRPWHPLKLVAHLDLDGVYTLTGLKQAMRAHYISDTVVPGLSTLLFKLRQLFAKVPRRARSWLRSFVMDGATTLRRVFELR